MMIYTTYIVVFLSVLDYCTCQCTTKNCMFNRDSCTSVCSDTQDMIKSMQQDIQKLNQQNTAFLENLGQMNRTTTIKSECATPKDTPPYNSSWKDCADVFKSGLRQSGVFRIQPLSMQEPVDVFCDTSNGGGWTVFQRRRDGSVSFNHTWNEYKNGFGDLNGEFWLGNEIVAAMTQTKQRWRVDLMNFKWETRYAEYANFQIRPESENYKLIYGSYSGTAGESLRISGHNGAPFSTPDRDNEYQQNYNAALAHGEGWWFTIGASAKLNGRYQHTRVKDPYSIWWYTWDGWFTLKGSEMKYRPMDY